MASKYSMNDRPSWPRRAIVTAGEPYGNKGLHFGHVGGVFVPADFFAYGESAAGRKAWRRGGQFVHIVRHYRTCGRVRGRGAILRCYE